MDSKELISKVKLENLKEPIQNSPALSKPFKLTDEDIPGVLKSCGVGAKFCKYQYPIPDNLRQFIGEKERGICLVGDVGTGKTTALVSFMRESLKNLEGYGFNKSIWINDQLKKMWRMIVYPEFIMELQDSYRHNNGEKTALDLLNKAARVKNLFIDDMGAEKPTDYVRQATYYLINYREMNLLPTFITSNFSMDHLDENIDKRISSRIAGMCEIIRMEGKDKRIGR